MAEIRLQQFRMDVSTGQIYSEFVFHDSFEVDQPVGTTLLAHQSACWMLAGYASGYASAFMGKMIIYREVECRSRGADRCRITGRPAAAFTLPSSTSTPSASPRRFVVP